MPLLTIVTSGYSNGIPVLLMFAVLRMMGGKRR